MDEKPQVTGYIATQASDGGLWHAGRPALYKDGYTYTACGRYGWVDHIVNDTPLPAVLDPDHKLPMQEIECLRCRRIVRRGRAPERSA